MSALGQKQTSAAQKGMSALAAKADIDRCETSALRPMIDHAGGGAGPSFSTVWANAKRRVRFAPESGHVERKSLKGLACSNWAGRLYRCALKAISTKLQP
jgi:hypothetical protein